MFSALIAALWQGAMPSAAVAEVSASAPAWARSPAPGDFARFYPRQAQADHLAGQVSLVCHVASDGALADCKTADASPSDAGFDEAALRMQHLFRMSPVAPDGHPSAGGTVKIPMVFRVPSDVRAAPVNVGHPAVSGLTVMLDCRYRGTHLDNCFTARGIPQEAAEVALKLAGEITLPPMPRPQGRITLPIAFSGGTATVSSPGTARAQMITAPDWLRRPSGRDLAEVFPRGAMRNGVEGVATTSCKVTKDGRLTECVILEEAPGGQGFGEAAIKLMPLFLMRPMARDGVPVDGGTIRIPLRFNLPRS